MLCQVAILGGGLGSMVTAWHLTQQKDWDKHFDITVRAWDSMKKTENGSVIWVSACRSECSALNAHVRR